MNEHEFCITSMPDRTAAEEDVVTCTIAVAFSCRTYGFDCSSSIEANDLVII